MGDVFDALSAIDNNKNPQAAPAAPAQSAQSAQPAATSPAPASPSGSGDAFDAISKEPQPQATTGTISSVQPSFLERMGRMFTEPMRAARGDAGVKDEEGQSGIINPAAAMTQSEQKEHPIATGIGQFVGDFTSPGNVLFMLASEGLGAATPLIESLSKAASPVLRAIPRLASAGFGAQMLYGAYQRYPQFKAALDAGDEAEALRILTHITLSGAMATQAAQHGIKGEVKGSTTGLQEKFADWLRGRKAQGAANEAATQPQGGTAPGPRTTVRPTTQKTAGVEAPIAATQQENPSIAARVAQRFTTPGAARDFQKSQTVPAAHKQITSALGQVMEDAINTHEAIAGGKEVPEAVAGTQQPSKFQTIDEAAQAGERAAKKTWQKGDAIDTRETNEWQQKADEIRQQVDEHNKLVEEHNANLAEGEEPMQPMNADEMFPEKPKTLAELRGDWSRAKANARSSDAAVRQKAFDEEVPNAEKALDKWFKQHSDEISQEEYNSVKRLTFQHERMQDIANKLRAPMATGSLTGNKLRAIEASFNNRGAKFGRPNAFKELLGPEGYKNWQNIAKILDPLKGPGQIERGLEAFSSILLGHLMPVGLATKLGTEFILNRALFDPQWGSAFTKAFAHFKLTGEVRPSDKRNINDLMKFARMTDDELKAAGFTQEQIDRGEHLPGVGGGAPDTVADDANRFNEDRDRPRVRQVTPAVHPRGKEIAEAYDAMKHNPNDPKVKASYDALKKDIDDQWEHAVQSGYSLEPWTGEGQPYANSKQMSDDVNSNRHLSFFTGGDMPADHPLAEVDPKTGLTYNDKFRAIHDLFGHAAHGHEFGPKGEEAAYRTHAQMFSPEAIPALTTETRGQNNWVNNGPHMQDAEGNVLKKGQKGWLPPQDRPYAQQKAGILPEEFHGEGGIAQDIADFHNANQGFTYNPARGEFVRDQQVYSVGMPNAPSEVFPKEKLTAEDVRNFMARPDVQKALNEDPRNSIGGWNYKGKAQLEVSKLFDNRDEAIAQGKRSNQTAIYDHANRTEIPTGGTAGEEARGEPIKAVHFSDADLTELDPQFYGSNMQDEINKQSLNRPDMARRQAYPQYWQNEVYLGRPSETFLKKGERFQTRANKYEADIDPNRIYDLVNDPDNIRGQVREELTKRNREKYGVNMPPSDAEVEAASIRKLKDLGYAGRHDINDLIAMWEKVPVKKVAPDVEVLNEPSAVNASGESAASQEAVNRSASEKAQGITRVRVKRGGEEVPLFGPDAVDAKAGKGETIVKRYPDGREEIQDQGAGANYRGPKPKGDAFDELDAKENEATARWTSDGRQLNVETKAQTKTGGSPKGFLQAFRDGDVVSVNAINTQEKGIGQGLYDRAIAEAKAAGAKTFASGRIEDMTPDAVKAWERLSKRYDVQKVNDPEMGERYEISLKEPDIRVGTKAGAEADTKFFKQAQENMPNATLGQQLREAQRLKEESGYGASNTGVTTDEYRAAVQRLNEQLGGLHSGIPLPLSELATIGRYHLEAGARAFGEWSSAMVDAVGDKVKPYLKDLWDGLQKEPAQGVRPDSEIPTVRNSTERNPQLTAGWDAIQKAIAADPDRLTQAGKPHEGYARRLLNTLIENHPDLGVKFTDEDIQNPQQALEKVINHWADNLTWLHDQMPAEFREASKQWYDTAHKTAQDWAAKYNMPVEKVAAVIAALSPKNAWDVNAGQAERMLDMYSNMRNHEWSDKMDDAAKVIMKRSKSDYRKAINAIRGKTYDQVGNTGDPKVDNYLKGLWMKMLDEAHGADTTPLFHPSGKVVGHVTMQWGMPEPMAKAVAILESDGSPETINSLMGDGHKIRNFYNNIVSPNSIIDHVTIDTHAGNADMLAPRGSDDPEIGNIFGKAPNNVDAGIKGTYALHAEAYRRAAAKLGIKPRELQSITWEGIRSMMGDVKKTPELRKTISKVWEDHREGHLTIDQAREKIVEATGGFEKPQWMTDAEWEKANGTDFDFGMNQGGQDGAEISTQ